MIVDKNKDTKKEDTSNQYSVEVTDNPLIEIYKAVKRTLGKLHLYPDDLNSELLFRTIRVNGGQFERIVRDKGNIEDAIDFPACFVNFTDVRFLTSQQRIGEGRATMRIRYILNNLNNQDESMETEGWRIFQNINDAIQDAKDTESALNERCNLAFYDMPESLDNGLQAYWIDYSVVFNLTSSYKYRNWKDVYFICPPFTNFSDAPDLHSGTEDVDKPSFDDEAKIKEPK